jgi:hypothetical protein
MNTRSYLFVVALAILPIALSGCGAGAPAPAASATRGLGPPAPTVAGISSPAVAGRQAGPYSVSMASAPNPAVRGANGVEVTVTDASGQPVSDAKVTFDLSMTNMNMGKNVVQATSAGSGRYTGNVFYSMGGPWRITVIVERAGQAAASTSFDLSVK